MARIIKANMVSLDEETHKVSVPEKSSFVVDNYTYTNYENEDGEDDGEDFAEDTEDLLRSAEQRAEEIIEHAHRAAESIVKETNERMEKEKEAIYEEARQKGIEAGERDAERIRQQADAQSADILEEAQNEKERLLRQIEPDAVSLIIEIIEKLAGDIVKLNPEVISHIVRTGLDGISGAKELAVRVSPDDYETALALKDEVAAYVDSDTSFSIIKDTSLVSGDCIIDTPIGSVDSSINVQLKTLKRDMIQIMKASNTENY